MEPIQADFGFDTKFSPRPGMLKNGKARFIGRCPQKGCKTTKARDCDCHERQLGGFVSRIADTSELTDTCPAHPLRSLKWEKVEGTFSEKFACDPRCTSATGRVCVCSCGGANHGAGWL